MTDSIESQLDLLLSESLSSVVERERSTFDQAAGPMKKSLVLFGAGGNGRKTLAGLRSLGIEPLAFVDNNSTAWNQLVDGLHVLSPLEAVTKFSQEAVFVVTIWRDIGGHPIEEIRQQLNAIAPTTVVSVAVLYWKYAETFLPYFFLDLPHKVLEQRDHVRAAFDLWADNRSRLEYVNQIRWRLWLDFSKLSPRVPWKPYLPHDLFMPDPQEIFVDAGAFTGDTLHDYIIARGSNFQRIIALEPDPTNFAALTAYRESLSPEIKEKISVLQVALGAQHGTVMFEANGSGQSSVTNKGNIEIECASLDELFPDTYPTYIKMDIEGAEMDALSGASRIIRDSAPVLAICVYHRIDHLWKLPLLLRSLSDKYAFFLRPHADACWDLVCYAVPLERLVCNPVAGERS